MDGSCKPNYPDWRPIAVGDGNLNPYHYTSAKSAGR